MCQPRDLRAILGPGTDRFTPSLPHGVGAYMPCKVCTSTKFLLLAVPADSEGRRRSQYRWNSDKGKSESVPTMVRYYYCLTTKKGPQLYGPVEIVYLGLEFAASECCPHPSNVPSWREAVDTPTEHACLSCCCLYYEFAFCSQEGHRQHSRQDC